MAGRLRTLHRLREVECSLVGVAVSTGTVLALRFLSCIDPVPLPSTIFLALRQVSCRDARLREDQS